MQKHRVEVSAMLCYHLELKKEAISVLKLIIHGYDEIEKNVLLILAFVFSEAETYVDAETMNGFMLTNLSVL